MALLYCWSGTLNFFCWFGWIFFCCHLLLSFYCLFRRWHGRWGRLKCKVQAPHQHQHTYLTERALKGFKTNKHKLQCDITLEDRCGSGGSLSCRIHSDAIHKGEKKTREREKILMLTLTQTVKMLVNVWRFFHCYHHPCA